jgi:hypothetical protein
MNLISGHGKREQKPLKTQILRLIAGVWREHTAG